MCVAAGYNERCHITTAFPTQGHIQMKQRITIYGILTDTPSVEFRGDAYKLAKEGWYVHTMVAYHSAAGDEFTVVYRKDEK